jgi:hypothetical protein
LSVKNLIDNNLSDALISLKLNYGKAYLVDFFSILPDLKKSLENDRLQYVPLQLIGAITKQKDEYRWSDLQLWVDGQHYFKGKGQFSKFKVLPQSLLSIEVTEMRSDLTRLKELSSRLTVPDELLRLGKVRFQGAFDGFLNDFVADGILISDLGSADIDVKFDLSNEGEQALQYSGSVKLDSFNLKGIMILVMRVP